jgi:hypothetical protein
MTKQPLITDHRSSAVRLKSKFSFSMDRRSKTTDLCEYISVIYYSIIDYKNKAEPILGGFVVLCTIYKQAVQVRYRIRHLSDLFIQNDPLLMASACSPHHFTVSVVERPSPSIAKRAASISSTVIFHRQCRTPSLRFLMTRNPPDNFPQYTPGILPALCPRSGRSERPPKTTLGLFTSGWEYGA